jgi:hypothetical protein
MGIHAQLVDFDAEFAKLSYEPVLVNDFDTSIAEQKEEFERHLYSHYKDSESIEDSASCDCRHTKTVQLLGVVCELCGTPVVSTTDRPIVPSMWIAAPDGVKGLVSPEVWIMLETALSVKEFNFLEFLTNTTYRYDLDHITSKETRRKLDRLLAKNFPRGLNNFITNFDEIVEFLFSANIIDTNKNDLYQFIQRNKHLFFPKYLPIPSKICFVVESTTSGVYIDKPIAAAIDAALTIVSIRSTAYALKPAVVQNRVVKSLKSLALFHEVYDRTRLARKPGLFRRHVFGSRLHFTARGVITSISDPHEYDELHVPWGIATQLLKYHLVNKLMKRGRTASEALAFVYSHVLRYNEELDEIFKELIAEAPEKGIAVTLHRNPTLQRGSTQLFYVTRIKPRVSDNTIGMSVICLRAPNADFDGDQLNMTLILDNELTNAMKRLAPHLWVMSLEEPHEISGNLELQGPVVETVVNWLHEDYLPPLQVAS